MIITEIRKQQKGTGKYNVFIDWEYAFALSLQDIEYFKIKEGYTIPEETYEFIQKNLVYIKAQDTALYYIGYKMRTEQEVRKKLSNKEFSDTVVDDIMTFLNKYRYVDDKEYAEKYVKDRKRSNPRSVTVLKQELQNKGIAEEICLEALEEEEVDEKQGVSYWIQKKTKGGTVPVDEKKKMQLYNFLQRKGYHYSLIKEAMRELEEEDEEE